MKYTTLPILALLIPLSINLACSTDNQNNENLQKKEKMHKQLKGELLTENRPSACKEGDDKCLAKEKAEAKKLMKKKLQDLKSEDAQDAQ